MHMEIKINDNFREGDCGLWYDVLVFDKKKLTHVHCVCPYTHCNNFNEAIEFYRVHHHCDYYTPICVQHHKYSKEVLAWLAMAA